MNNTGYEYDTAAIRREARKLSRCADMIESSAISRLDKAEKRLDGNFIGSAADALDNSLERSRRELRALQSDISSVSGALDRFADALEEADRRMAQLMGK